MPLVKPYPSTTFQHRVIMLVAGGTTAQEPERTAARVGDLVRRARWDRHSVAGAHGCRFLSDPHQAAPIEDEVDLFGRDVMVRGCATARRQTGLGQRLVANGRIAMGQKLPNLRAVLRGERRNAVPVTEPSWPTERSSC